MKVTFWGTRGSIPAPGPGTVRVGGNTTCLEVSTENGVRIVVDAGTGIRALGLALAQDSEPDPVTLLMTHSHWDHLAGFIFFKPAYDSANRISVYGNKMALEVLRRDIFESHDNRYFPVNMNNFHARIEFFDELPNPLTVGDVSIRAISLNHPGNGYAFRFTRHGKSFAFITDNEIGMRYDGGNSPAELLEFCHGLDVLIHDAQYLTTEIDAHRGWGHSTYAEVLDLAYAAAVPHVYLTHHDPERDDAGCDTLLAQACEYIAARKLNVTCELAIEGASFTV